MGEKGIFRREEGSRDTRVKAMGEESECGRDRGSDSTIKGERRKEEKGTKNLCDEATRRDDSARDWDAGGRDECLRDMQGSGKSGEGIQRRSSNETFIGAVERETVKNQDLTPTRYAFRQRLSWGNNTFTAYLEKGKTYQLVVVVQGTRSGMREIGQIMVKDAPYQNVNIQLREDEVSIN